MSPDTPDPAPKPTRRQFLKAAALAATEFLLPSAAKAETNQQPENLTETFTPRLSPPNENEMGWHHAPGEWYYLSAIHPTERVGFIISAGKTPLGEGVLVITYSQDTYQEEFYQGTITAAPQNTELNVQTEPLTYSLLGRPNSPYEIALTSPELVVSSTAEAIATFWHGEDGNGQVPTSEKVISDPYYSQLLIPTGKVQIQGVPYQLNDFYVQLDHQVLLPVIVNPQPSKTQSPEYYLPANHNWICAHLPPGPKKDKSIIIGTTLGKKYPNPGYYSAYLIRLYPDGSIKTQPGATIISASFGESGHPQTILIVAPSLGIQELSLSPFSPGQIINGINMLEAFGSGTGNIDNQQINDVRAIIESTQRQFTSRLPLVNK